MDCSHSMGLRTVSGDCPEKFKGRVGTCAADNFAPQLKLAPLAIQVALAPLQRAILHVPSQCPVNTSYRVIAGRPNVGERLRPKLSVTDGWDDSFQARRLGGARVPSDRDLRCPCTVPGPSQCCCCHVAALAWACKAARTAWSPLGRRFGRCNARLRADQPSHGRRGASTLAWIAAFVTGSCVGRSPRQDLCASKANRARGTAHFLR
ncbi:hypothetical protein PYCCODRAFT_1198266 [Trametes coccinea BRFM310]|uniref:Uncharacterized protein n=1 Tax=Trametes coccinea (strain BRFM310) TaxID=1353009 RepID=A0A1Y2I9N4_TRAC3|nr:hypothetical protein PYCCODRAFT_1198266 [Trametes coccinea BRFM310]